MWIFVRHVGYFHWLVDGKDDFHFLGMKFAKKSILGPKWELTQNIGTKIAFSFFFFFFLVLKLYEPCLVHIVLFHCIS